MAAERKSKTEKEKKQNADNIVRYEALQMLAEGASRRVLLANFTDYFPDGLPKDATVPVFFKKQLKRRRKDPKELVKITVPSPKLIHSRKMKLRECWKLEDNRTKVERYEDALNDKRNQ